MLNFTFNTSELRSIKMATNNDATALISKKCLEPVRQMENPEMYRRCPFRNY